MLTAADVRARRFTRSRWREGYDPAEVDALMERVARALASLERDAAGGDGLTPDDVVNSRFAATKLREGYDQDEVDDFLDEVADTLRAAHRPEPLTSTGGAPGGSSGHPASRSRLLGLRAASAVATAVFVVGLVLLVIGDVGDALPLGAMVAGMVGSLAAQLLIFRAERRAEGE